MALSDLPRAFARILSLPMPVVEVISPFCQLGGTRKLLIPVPGGTHGQPGPIDGPSSLPDELGCRYDPAVARRIAGVFLWLSEMVYLFLRDLVGLV